MNAQQVIEARNHLAHENAQYDGELEVVPIAAWELAQHSSAKRRIRVLRSNRFLVQVFQETADVIRLSICRTAIKDDGSYQDGITWDELMLVKRQAGYGFQNAVEFYPDDRLVVNVANMRHLFITREPLPFMWMKPKEGA